VVSDDDKRDVRMTVKIITGSNTSSLLSILLSVTVCRFVLIYWPLGQTNIQMSAQD
jgi:hypothetical protein